MTKLHRAGVVTVLGLALSLSASRPAVAEKVAEAATGVQFDAQKSWDGKAYTLVGTGVRKKFIVKVYAMALYVENVDGKRAFSSLATKAGGSDQAKLTEGDRAQSFLIWGSFGKVAVMQFVRDVDGAKIKGAFEEGFADELSDKAPADVRTATQEFLKLFDKDLKTGDQIVLRTSADGKIDVSIGGQAKGSVQNAKLVRALWSIWLGGHPISKELRADLVNRISELGK
jgi:long-chain acyl-CoA synthetase